METKENTFNVPVPNKEHRNKIIQLMDDKSIPWVAKQNRIEKEFDLYFEDQERFQDEFEQILIKRNEEIEKFKAEAEKFKAENQQLIEQLEDERKANKLFRKKTKLTFQTINGSTLLNTQVWLSKTIQSGKLPFFTASGDLRQWLVNEGLLSKEQIGTTPCCANSNCTDERPTFLCKWTDRAFNLFGYGNVQNLSGGVSMARVDAMFMSDFVYILEKEFNKFVNREG